VLSILTIREVSAELYGFPGKPDVGVPSHSKAPRPASHSTARSRSKNSLSDLERMLRKEDFSITSDYLKDNSNTDLL
ncbi:hypothetical protein AVEN_76998-1, partial [Araneus ventricosus]